MGQKLPGLELIKSLGADQTIDYTTTDFTESSEKYDFIFDAVAKASHSRSKRALNKNGIFLSSHDTHGSVVIKTEDMIFLKELIKAGKLKSVIDRCYPLEQMESVGFRIIGGVLDIVGAISLLLLLILSQEFMYLS